MKLFTIPNLLTLCNLLCGCIAIVFVFEGNLVWSAYLVGIACVFDFLDGFVARALKQHSPIGKDLDSLADMVTFGVVPGVVMFQMLRLAIVEHDLGIGFWGANKMSLANYPYAFIAFLIPVFSALRLAKFNNDSRQSDSFIGVPTPANSILICALPLILEQTRMAGFEVYVKQGSSTFSSLVFGFIGNPYLLIALTFLMSILLISEIPLFALKFKSFGWKGNEIRYFFLLISIAMIVVLKFIALPLVIVLYILMSVVNNLVAKK